MRNLRLQTASPFPSMNEGVRTVNPAQYRVEMIRHYKEVSIDSNTTGWYLSSQLDEFLNQSFIETQASYQKSLGHKCVALIHDVSRSAMGNLHIRAYRLSDNFMAVYNKGKFTSSNLLAAKLDSSNILVEVPLTLVNTDIASVLLHELDDDSALFDGASSSGPALNFAITDPVTLGPNYSSLELNTEPYIQKNLQTLLDSFEDFSTEQNTLQYHQRALVREKTRIQNYMQTKRTENETRVARGLGELPLETEEQVSLKFKVPPEPPRLDLLLINHQINSCCSQLNQFTGPALTKMYATQALQLPNQKD
ncbi:hypothetical protein DSO57_1029372 [Entomophthora muscae]|uniref:Uncharacterized protein n=1 Tax=Entomophthora muscae TaxID=34485 RepID=A0ACC2RSB1_9FUNG|nr:hypothetical protein DSO57_1029372 [Entomophthora muscae]